MAKNVRLQLNQITRANASARAVVAKAVQDQGRDEVQFLAARFEGEKYFDRAGGSRTLGRNTKRWNERKASLGLDPRRGHASGALQASFNDAGAFKPTPYGFIFDLSLTSRVSKVGKRTQPTSVYLPHYSRQKAGGAIGRFGTPQRNRMKSKGVSALRQHYVKHGVRSAGGKLKFKVLYG